MSQTNDPVHRTSGSEIGSTMPQTLVDRFEQAWEAGRRPLLDEYLPEDGAQRRQLVGVLVHIDLERRLKAGEKARVETYLERYAELADDCKLVLALIAREYRLRRRQEPALTPGEYVKRFPDRAAEVQERLEQDATATGATTVAGSPGGARYRPVRFHARGGLGEVFVALDEEVHREVALKRMQPRHADDPEVLRRFLREAEITAQLEHPGIVPVYGVVRDADGQPCYAMRFIQGDSLDEAIQEFHQADKGERDPSARSLALRQLLQRFITVCNTIAYAHSRGVIHRDLKPGNIMLGKYGETLVVDWGLARTFERSAPERAGGEETLTPAAGTPEQTQLGQAQGTPAYMSPEQAAGRWDVIGPATDIYSLGATLYALLTGQPPFRGGNPVEVMQLVQQGAVMAPRQVKKEVPPALEAVCLKAMAPKPEDRYPTAQDLAADIEPWLADEPVSAYREPWRTRARRWVKRHRLLATGVVVALVMTVLLGAGSWAWWAWGRAETASQVEAALENAKGLYEQGKVYEALAEARRATGLLGSGGGAEELRQRVRLMLEDLEMVDSLEEVRLQQSEVKGGGFNIAGAEQGYGALFQRLGADVDRLTVSEAAARIQHRLIKDRLIAALDHWTLVRARRTGKLGDWRKLAEVASRVDPDSWQNRLRAALVDLNAATLKTLALAATKERADLPPPTLVLCGEVLETVGHLKEAIQLLRAAQQKYPGDFWINHNLAFYLATRNPPDTDEAIRFYTAALALRWRSPAVHYHLGLALIDKGLVDDAVAAFKAALRLQKDYPLAHFGLGRALAVKGDVDGAIKELETALRLKKDFPEAYNGLGIVLCDHKSDYDGAIRAFETALRLKKDFPEAQVSLGYALYKKGDLDGAIQAYQAALRLKKDFPQAHNNLGDALRNKGDLQGAIKAYQEALRLQKDYPEAHLGLGLTLKSNGDLPGAIKAYQEALRLKKDYPEAHYNLGNAMIQYGKVDEAVKAYQAALRLKKDFPEAQGNLGNALANKGDLDGAIAAFKEVLRLKKDDPLVYNNLGLVLKRKGDVAGAIPCFEKALALSPKLAQAHWGLGEVLLQSGRFTQAKTATQRSLDLLPPDHPLRPLAIQQLRECERLLELDARLLGILTGDEHPADTAEQLALADLCQRYRKRYGAAARFYADAFAAGAALTTKRAYDAARAALLAASGQGEDANKLDGKECLRLRQQALDWLRDALQSQMQRLKDADAKTRAAVWRTLEHWQQDADLARVRDAKALAKLPEAERQAWQQLWADVDKLLNRTDSKK
jgi:tetratricopeptide (TPR) repeat protein/tRNA A-37 threonylcarbamoyl transferase component Bud32